MIIPPTYKFAIALYSKGFDQHLPCYLSLFLCNCNIPQLIGLRYIDSELDLFCNGKTTTMIPNMEALAQLTDTNWREQEQEVVKFSFLVFLLLFPVEHSADSLWSKQPHL